MCLLSGLARVFLGPINALEIPLCPFDFTLVGLDINKELECADDFYFPMTDPVVWENEMIV